MYGSEIYLFYFTLLILCVKPSRCETEFYQITEKTEMKDSNVLSTENNINMLQCARRCKLVDNCYTALYGNIDRTCMTVERSNQILLLQSSWSSLERYKYVCDDGWTLFQFSCYFASETVNDWVMSSEVCSGQGGHLVTITTAEEHKFVASFRDEIIGENMYVWAGGRNVSTDGTWGWQWVTDENWNYEIWAPYEPSGINYNGIIERCLQIFPSTREADSSWNDGECSATFRSICEKQASLIGVQ